MKAGRTLTEAERAIAEVEDTLKKTKHVVALVFHAALLSIILTAFSSIAMADHLRLTDGTSIEVDEAWEDTQGIWYRRGGVTHLLDRARVRAIERKSNDVAGVGEVKTSATKSLVQTVAGEMATSAETLPTVWIYLVGGARMEVDEATETLEGVWYRRGNLSIFVERTRIERIEREQPKMDVAEADAGDAALSKRGARRERFWTTGNKRIDALIRQNGVAYGVDPYLVFCVMENESSFNSRALSPKGARGLMQLMPATAARFGVSNAHDPAQSIRAGTRYLKELMRRFNGRVDLALAGYNAGEGTVMKYGHRVPPYRETRNYVRRITARYQRGD
ncbi:MAG TPA: lytic transglycosylase domain-containing protein [Pyrinomonadaceae bacterium]